MRKASKIYRSKDLQMEKRRWSNMADLEALGHSLSILNTTIAYVRDTRGDLQQATAEIAWV